MDILSVQRLEVQHDFNYEVELIDPSPWKEISAVSGASVTLYGRGRVLHLGNIVVIRPKKGEARRTRNAWSLFDKKILLQEGCKWE